MINNYECFNKQFYIRCHGYERVEAWIFFSSRSCQFYNGKPSKKYYHCSLSKIQLFNMNIIFFYNIFKNLTNKKICWCHGTIKKSILTTRFGQHRNIIHNSYTYDNRSAQYKINWNEMPVSYLKWICTKYNKCNFTTSYDLIWLPIYLKKYYIKYLTK